MKQSVRFAATALLSVTLLSAVILLNCGEEKSGYKYEYVNIITEPELVSVGADIAVFSWVSDTKGDGHIYYSDGESEKTIDCGQPPTKFHYCSLSGLEPGADYVYELISGDKTAGETERSPGTFTTLVPPPGELLFSFATINDMHIGEEIAGLICTADGCLNEGFFWPEEDNPYWLFMNESVVDEINKRDDIDFIIIKGDLTSEHREEEFVRVKEILDRSEAPYYVARGNHDRVGNDPDDYFLRVFNLAKSWYSFVHGGVLFAVMDSNIMPDLTGRIEDAQIQWLEGVLEADKDKKAFVISHHPLTKASGIQRADDEDSIKVLNVLKEYDVAGILSGHSHAANLTTDEITGPLLCSETPSSKEYPGGYSVISVYEGGWMSVFHRAACDECREWIEITKDEYWGTATTMLFGKLEERSFVYVW